MLGQQARRVAVIGGVRIPFCRAHTAYARCSNQDMMTAVLRALVAKYSLAGQRLGDVSLFIAGFFARSFARKLIDVDYHIAMGGNAYSSLADTLQRSFSGRFVSSLSNAALT